MFKEWTLRHLRGVDAAVSRCTGLQSTIFDGSYINFDLFTRRFCNCWEFFSLNIVISLINFTDYHWFFFFLQRFWFLNLSCKLLLFVYFFVALLLLPCALSSICHIMQLWLDKWVLLLDGLWYVQLVGYFLIVREHVEHFYLLQKLHLLLLQFVCSTPCW